jgi:hypothetical protein
MEKASRPVVITTNMRSFVDSHRCRLVSESEGTQTPIAQLSWIQVRACAEHKRVFCVAV